MTKADLGAHLPVRYHGFGKAASRLMDAGVKCPIRVFLIDCACNMNIQLGLITEKCQRHNMGMISAAEAPWFHKAHVSEECYSQNDTNDTASAKSKPWAVASELSTRQQYYQSEPERSEVRESGGGSSR